MKTLINTAPPMKSLILASVLAFSAAFSAVLGPDPAKADYTFRPGPYGTGSLTWQMTPRPFIPLVTVRPHANYYYRPRLYYRPVLRYYYPRPIRYRIHYWRYR